MVRRTVQGEPAQGEFWHPPAPPERAPLYYSLIRRFRSDRIAHTLVPAVAFAVVVGGGLGHATPSAAMPMPPKPIAVGYGSASLHDQHPAPSASSTTTSTSRGIKLATASYTARGGQTLAGVAEATGRSESTLLWANSIQEPEAPLRAGTVLTIPPTDGVLYTVQAGDTLAGIAESFNVKVSGITGYAGNNVQGDADLKAGDQLMIPGATPSSSRSGVVTYTVEAGDTIRSIAARYGLKTMTVMGVNHLKDYDTIWPGQKLVILPTDGVMVDVQSGQTLATIAQLWGVDVATIANYAPNHISNPNDIVVGQPVIIPGVEAPEWAVFPPPPPPPTPTTSTTTSTTDSTDASQGGAKTATATTAATQAKAQGVPGTSSTASNSSKPEQETTKPQLAEADKPKPITTQTQTTTSDAQAAKQEQQPTPTPPTPTPTPPPPPPTPTPTPKPAVQQAPASRFIWPVQGTVTQGFGPTDVVQEPSYGGYAHYHTGVDIANSVGTPIHAAASGTVIFAGWNSYGYGYCVQVDVGGGLVTLYGHMNAQPAVYVGEHVAQGQYLGPMGSTGNSTGPHTHFEIDLNGVPQNPFNYLP